MSGKPLFPFGYGLSYTTFSYGDIRLSSNKIKPDEIVTVVVDIENSGKCKGDEVVQLYLHDPVASMARPVKELKRFKRITLEPKEKRKVTFTLTPEDFAFLDASMKRIIEPGTIEIFIGRSSEDIRSRAELEILSE
jgi:beta-glucosidase